MKKIAFIFSAVAASVALATPIDKTTARAAASAFVASDGVGAVVFRGRTVKAVFDRDGLWIVSLDPAGHVILAGSDLVDPIVGFSVNDFVEPDSESPAYAMLSASAEASRAAEVSGGVRHAKWNRLLGGGAKPRLMAAGPVDSPETIVIPPFLESHYNQWQPYNDYAPVYDASTNKLDSYRGRCPCGCVATAAAQGFRHFRWPARIDRVDSFVHSFTDTNNVTTSFPIRFNGFIPVNWGALEDSYVNGVTTYVTNYNSNGGYSWWTEWKNDLRGNVAESVRYPIARLILFADVLAHMSFGSDASGANYGTVSGNASDWYTPGTWVSADDSRILADIASGVPVQVRIPGHAVVGHGWATDGSDSYIYLNYGWGGSNDGYYNIGEGLLQEVYVGHYPRAKPQLDPLPKVCGTSVTLNWHFPDFYTNKLSGFTVFASKTATSTSTLLDDFSASAGVSSSDNIYVTADSVGNDGNLLFTKPFAAGTYTFSGSYTLTSASVLTFKVYSFAALGAEYRIEARFDGGDWTPLCTPALMTGWGGSGWSMERVYLGSHGGQTAQFRICNAHRGPYYPQDDSRILLDDFKVTEVLVPESPAAHSVGKAARSLTLSGLTPGATYSFSVVPTVSGALVDGEASEPMAASIAGERRTPVPGVETYAAANLSFSAADTSGTWSYSGTVVDDTTILDKSSCSIAVAISGKLTATSSLSFGWSANNYYENGSDTLTVVFTAADGTATTVWTATNSQNMERQNVSVALGEFAGQSGKLAISTRHSGSCYVGDQYGGRLYAPCVTNVQIPSAPAAAWATETLTALGTPEIRSVSNVAEGFYGECGLGATTFNVTCSESVASLAALPSHLSLVCDNDVTVTPKGNGKFSVRISPSGVTDDNARSRMILTLAATDTNGTVAYKDLSLRFEKRTAAASVTVNAQSAHGSALTVEIPYSWFVECGLAADGASAEVFESLAEADSDGDGRANWLEYICQTDPTDATKKLMCFIEVINGHGKVTYEPSELRPGFRAVIKGTDDLRAVEWTTVTTTTSPLHFFTVVIENE